MADLATIARPYAEALFRSAKPADLALVAATEGLAPALKTVCPRLKKANRS